MSEAAAVYGLRSAVIAPLTAGDRGSQVAERLRQAIQLGLIVDGEQLPTEVDLATQLGVSPMTLREALAVLREQGLVETKRGRSGGTFVRRPAVPVVSAVRKRLADASITNLRDLADEHFAVSGTAAKLAAERASNPSVRRILALVDQLSDATDIGTQLRADSRFHIEIAIAAQSERLTQLEVALQAEQAELLWVASEDPTLQVNIVAEHHAIATAIAAEKPDEARSWAERHVQRNLRRLTDMHLALIAL